MNLVLFDFDGTITRDDSLLEFVAYVVGFKKFFRGILVLSPPFWRRTSWVLRAIILRAESSWAIFLQA